MLFKFTLFFALLPNIGTTLISSDTQPFAFLFAGLGLVKFWLTKGIRFYSISIPFLIMLICAILSSTFFSKSIFSIDSFRYFFGYLSAPVIIIYILSQIHQYDSKRIAKVIDIAIYVMFFGVFLQMINLSSIINFFVNRAIFSQGFSTGRGFTSFFTEQSQFVSQLGLTVIFYYLINELTRKRIILLTCLIISTFAGHVLVLVFQIFLSFLLAIIISLFMGKINFKKYSKKILPVSAFFGMLFFLRENIISIFENLNLPVLGIRRIVSLIEIGGAYIARDEGIIVKTSGIFHTISSIIDRPFAFYLGSTASSNFAIEIFETYSTISQNIMSHTNLAFPLRLYSAFGNWIVDFGVIGLLCFIIFTSIVFLRIINNSGDYLVKYLVSFFYLIQASLIYVPLSNPTIHVMMAFIFYYSLHVRPHRL